MGGSDDADNLIECTVEEHANFHKKLYEKYGNEFDLIAYRGLSGQVTMTEAKRLAQLEGTKKGAKISNEIRKAKGNTIGAWSKKHNHVATIATLESRQKGASILNSQRWKCLECGIENHASVISRHQKAKGHTGKEKICLQ
jgi:REP element-mobilizing transposase RayT